MRPEQLVFVTGTGTDIGKTWVTVRLAVSLRSQSVKVGVRKPVQSYEPADNEPTDAELLAKATGETQGQVCHSSRTYPVPLAPPMAAAQLGLASPRLDELLDACSFPVGVEVGLVEGVGGLHSPLTEESDNLDLIDQLDPDLVVVVTEGGLGSIHNVRAVTTSLDRHPHVTYINRIDTTSTVQQLNLNWMKGRGSEVVTSIEELTSCVLNQTQNL